MSSLNLTRNQIYIGAAVSVIVIIAFFLFLKKKKETFKGVSSENSLILYYSPGCGYCHMFMNSKNPSEKSDWAKVKQQLHKKIKIQEVNCKNDDCLDIPGYPTIVLVKNNKRIFFNEQRTIENIVKFVNQNL